MKISNRDYCWITGYIVAFKGLLNRIAAEQDSPAEANSAGEWTVFIGNFKFCKIITTFIAILLTINFSYYIEFNV